MARVRRLASGHWQACWRDPEGRERSRTFRLKGEADDFATEIEHSKLVGSYSFDPGAARVTLAQLWRERSEAAARTGRPAASTLAKERGVWKLYVEPALGDRPIIAIRRSDVRALVEGVALAVSAHQAVEVRKLVRVLLGRAVSDERLGRNVAALVEAPTIPDRRPQVVEPVDVERFASAVPERYRALIILGAYGSLRWSEMVALTVDRVDWIRQVVFVDEKIVEVGARFYRGQPKTERSRRAVPVPGVVIEALARHVELFGTGPGGLIFASRTGRPIRRGVFYRFAWWPAREALGLDGFKAKNLRHTGATIAGELSGDPNLVKDRLGHSSLAMVSRVYQGVFDRRHREVAERMDELARRAREEVAAPARADGMRMAGPPGGSSGPPLEPRSAR